MSDSKCTRENILVRPAEYEESCFIFDKTRALYNMTTAQIVSLGVTEVIYPFGTTYDFYRLNYNHRFNMYPVAIVRAHTVRDIRRTIKYCQKFGIPIRLRGGAHAYQPASLMDFGVVLDQRPRQKVRIGRDRVKIEAGALLGPVIDALADHDLTIPFGTCVTNGVAGLTLGGGIGFLVRLAGLTLDACVGLSVVLANRKVVKCTRSKHPDLFWALRGAGGGNFGVVTNLTFKPIRIKYVTTFTLTFKFDDLKTVFKVWQPWSHTTIPQLSTELDIFNRFKPVLVVGQLSPIRSRRQDRVTLQELLAPLLDLNLHTSFELNTKTLREAAEMYGAGSYARPLFFYNRSDFAFRRLPDAAIDVIIKHMSLLDQTQDFHKTEIDALGGNFAHFPPTSFPYRSATQWIQYTSLWATQTEAPANIQWLDDYYRELRPYFPENAKYVNALDYNQTRSEALESYFGPNVPALIEVKRKYDPTDFFNFEQSVPVAVA